VSHASTDSARRRGRGRLVWNRSPTDRGSRGAPRVRAVVAPKGERRVVDGGADQARKIVSTRMSMTTVPKRPSRTKRHAGAGGGFAFAAGRRRRPDEHRDARRENAQEGANAPTKKPMILSAYGPTRNAGRR